MAEEKFPFFHLGYFSMDLVQTGKWAIFALPYPVKKAVPVNCHQTLPVKVARPHLLPGGGVLRNCWRWWGTLDVVISHRNNVITLGTQLQRAPCVPALEVVNSSHYQLHTGSGLRCQH